MTQGEKAKRGPGRPRTTPHEGSRRNATIQIGSALYDKVKVASDQSGLSLSREMEQRIADSFRDDNLRDTLLGGDRAARLLQYAATAMRTARSRDGKSWENDPQIANAVGMAMYYLAISCSRAHSEAAGMLRDDDDVSRRVKYAAQMISNYTILSYGAEFDESVMDGREGGITAHEAIQRFIVNAEKI